MPRRRTTNAHWTAIINDFRRSGLNQSEFCRRRSLSLPSLHYHLYKPNASKPASDHHRSASNPHFPPVTILPDPIPPKIDPQLCRATFSRRSMSLTAALPSSCS
jgi:hypothetical protein